MKKWYVLIGIGAVVMAVLIAMGIERTEPLERAAVRAYLGELPATIGLPFDTYNGDVRISQDGRYMGVEGFSTTGESAYESVFGIIDLARKEVVMTGAGDIVSRNRAPLFFIGNSATDETSRVSIKDQSLARVLDTFAYKIGFSPSGEHVFFDTFIGPRIVRLGDEAIVYRTADRHAFELWHPDGIRVFGFYATGRDLGDGAREYKLAWFDTETNEWTDIALPIQMSVFKGAVWIEEGKLIWLTAGFDDGSFEYVLDLERGTPTFIKETSGGEAFVALDRERGRFIIADDATLSTASFTGSPLDVQELPLGYYRDSLIALPGNRVLYRQTLLADPVSEFVVYDFGTRAFETIARVTDVMGMPFYDEATRLLVMPTRTKIETILIE